MKLYISENIDKAIEGFTIIPIVYGELDLSGVPDNAASTIVATDAIDTIKMENIGIFIASIARKMRLNSELYISGLDIYALNKALLNGSITLSEFNELAKNKQGFYSGKYILDLLQSNGVNIKSMVYKGYYYELSATRSRGQN
jgi:hypothetical protein